MSDGAKIVIAGIMAYTIYRVAGKCTDARACLKNICFVQFLIFKHALGLQLQL